MSNKTTGNAIYTKENMRWKTYNREQERETLSKNLKIFMFIGILILFLWQVGTVSAWVCSNNNGVFTVNESNGYIISLKDKVSGLEYIRPDQRFGISYFSNGTFYSGSNNPTNNLGTNFTIYTNTTSKFVLEQRQPHYNITYVYDCYSEKLDINAQIKKTDGFAGVITNNYSDFQLRYNFGINATTLNNSRFILWAGSNYAAYNRTNLSSVGDITPSLNGVEPFNNGAFYINNGSQSLLIQDNNLYQSSNTLSTQFRVDYPNSAIQRQLLNEMFLANNTYNFSLSLVLGKDYLQSQYAALNQSSNKKSSLQGSWYIYYPNCTNNLAYFQTLKRNGASLVQIHDWFPWYGYYPTDNSNWVSTAGFSVNKACINNLVSLINQAGLSPNLYFNARELQEQNASAYFPDSIVINNTGGYKQAYQGSALPSQTYLMDLSIGSWYNNITSNFANVLLAYPNISGIFLDRMDYVDVNYNGTNRSFTTTTNQTFDLIQDGMMNFLQFAYNQTSSSGKNLILNIPNNIQFIKYSDAITIDTSDANSYKGINMRLASLGRYSFIFGEDTLPNRHINNSILWGIYPSYSTLRDTYPSVYADFNQNIDEFTVSCAGITTIEYVPGKIAKYGAKLYSAGGDGVACISMNIPYLNQGYYIDFYGKGYVTAQFYNGSTISYIENLNTGQNTTAQAVWTTLNSNQPFSDWTPFRIFLNSTSTSSATLYLYNHLNNIGGSHAAYYSFLHDSNRVINDLNLVNLTANQYLQDWDSDLKRTIYPNAIGINKDFNFTFNSNSDWYDMSSHRLVATNTNFYNYTQTSSIANVIYYNFTAKYNNLHWDSVNQRVRFLDSNNNEIDQVQSMSQQDAIFNNINQGSYNISIDSLNNALVFYINGSLDASSNVASNDGNMNLTLNYQDYVYILDNFNLTEGILRTNSPITFAQSTLTEKTISSNLTDPVTTQVITSNLPPCEEVTHLRYTPNGGSVSDWTGQQAKDVCTSLTTTGYSLTINSGNNVLQVLEQGSTPFTSTILKILIGFLGLTVLAFSLTGIYLYIKNNFNEISVVKFVEYAIGTLVFTIFMVVLITVILNYV